MRDSLINQLEQVARIAGYSKLQRLLNNPYKYVRAVFFKEFIYPKTRKEITTSASLFYGACMKIALPASTDIYLTGGKSHHSEIRLAKFIILNLKEGGHFLDVGAHYGYFTLLASYIVGDSGKVLSFEPASNTYRLLEENTRNLSNTLAYHKAVSDNNDGLTLYEFPNLYSEYNTSDVAQFEHTDWFRKAAPNKVEVPSTTIDQVIHESEFLPVLIKIDVEGAEYSVIAGALQLITDHAPLIVMEYLAPTRHNEGHKKAAQLLQQQGYHCCLILPDGTLTALEDPDKYLLDHQLESDNIVFKKGV